MSETKKTTTPTGPSSRKTIPPKYSCNEIMSMMDLGFITQRRNEMIDKNEQRDALNALNVTRGKK